MRRAASIAPLRLFRGGGVVIIPQGRRRGEAKALRDRYLRDRYFLFLQDAGQAVQHKGFCIEDFQKDRFPFSREMNDQLTIVLGILDRLLRKLDDKDIRIFAVPKFSHSVPFSPDTE